MIMVLKKKEKAKKILKQHINNLLSMGLISIRLSNNKHNH